MKLMNPSLGNLYIMFNALHVVNNNQWNILSYSLYFYTNMVKYYPIQINVINKLGQK